MAMQSHKKHDYYTKSCVHTCTLFNHVDSAIKFQFSPLNYLFIQLILIVRESHGHCDLTIALLLVLSLT